MFGMVSTIALAAGVVADLVYGDGSHRVAVLVCGLTLVGVAAVFMALATPHGDGGDDSEPRIGSWG